MEGEAAMTPFAGNFSKMAVSVNDATARFAWETTKAGDPSTPADGEVVPQAPQ